MSLPRLAITAGEPAGIGPELLIKLAATSVAADLVAIGDRGLLQRAAARCGLSVVLLDDDGSAIDHRAAGNLRLRHMPLQAVEVPGQPDPANARYVLSTLSEAAEGCTAGRYDAIVTAPLQKSSINDAGIRFSGHTEFFAE
jgi:4-hydroxythreonine-4-phosphate dehydrogenase